MAPKVFPTFTKVKNAFSPFVKRSVIPSLSSSSSSVSTGSPSIDKFAKDQVEPKVLKTLDLEEQKKEFFENLLIDVTYNRSLKFIFSVCDLIDEELAVLNAKLIERGFDLGEARARRKSRVFFPNSVSKEEMKCAKQLEQVKREIEFYRQQKSVFENLCKTRIQQIEFMNELRQERSSQQTLVVVLAQQ